MNNFIQPKQLLNKVLSLSKTLRIDRFIGKRQEGFLAINLGKSSVKGLAQEVGSISDYFIIPNKGLGPALKKLWVEKKFSSKSVKVSIKDSACLVRCFKFPKMDTKKLEQALFYELNKYIPYSPEEVYFDFSVLTESNPNELLILLAVAKKSFVDEVLSVFSRAGLSVSEINLDIICLMNLFLNNYPDSKQSNACLLDIGANFSSLAILNKGIPFLIRDVKFNAKEVFDSIARIKSISSLEVEAQVKNQKDNPEFLESAQDSISNLCKEIKSSFDYFEVNSSEAVDRLYLTGGLASVFGINNVFNSFLETETLILDVFDPANNNLGESFPKEEFQVFKNSFSSAFGLRL